MKYNQESDKIVAEINKIPFDFRIDTGIIKKKSKKTIPNPFETGRGMHISDIGYVTPPVEQFPDSTTVKFILEYDNKEEREFIINGYDLGIKNEERTTLFWGRKSTAKKYCLLFIYHHKKDTLTNFIGDNTFLLLNITKNRFTHT